MKKIYVILGLTGFILATSYIDAYWFSPNVCIRDFTNGTFWNFFLKCFSETMAFVMGYWFCKFLSKLKGVKK